jgi:hypothetical protein
MWIKYIIGAAEVISVNLIRSKIVYNENEVEMGDSGSESESESESAIPTPIPMLNILKYTDSGTILKMIKPIPIRFRFQLTKKNGIGTFS